MPVPELDFWSDAVGRTFGRYDEPLLRRVAGRLFKPRSQWPADELVERGVATLANAAVIDRRLEDLEPAGRQLLALMAHSRQPVWKVGSLVELLVALGHADGLRPVLDLFEAGLLYPAAEENAPRLKSFEQWLAHGADGMAVFAHPSVTARALGEDLGLPECPGATTEARGVQEADGLEWPLRLAALWQLVTAAPLRRTQQGEFFKRDFDRLVQDPLLNAPPAEALAELPDAGLLAVALAQLEGIVQEREGELVAGTLPTAWDEGLPAALASLWANLPRLEGWNPGGQKPDRPGNPYPSAHLLALLLLGGLPDGAWASPAGLDEWVAGRHPFWAGAAERGKKGRREATGITTFLLAVAYPLRLLQAAKGADGDWVVRLSLLGRWLLGLGDLPATTAPYMQTLLVQPNLEVLVYRQGLTPGLIGRLSKFAAWKSLGAACTLQLQADTVYRAMESGLEFGTILQMLEQHGMRPTPTAVVESLRTWANKRERISVYGSAALFEFASPEDLNEALARGLPGVRLSDRLALVTNEGAVDFRHFRLTGTRDYGLPPEKCVEVEGDGVTLGVDLARSDLLLETELTRFAEPIDGAGVNGRRRYRLTPESLAAGRETGLSVPALDGWFQQRAGQPLSPAARLLLTGSQGSPPELKRLLVLHVGTADLADGLQQWPGTRALVRQRLGPTTLAVDEEHAEALMERLRALGVTVQPPSETP
jgi:hypothetical protein